MIDSPSDPVQLEPFIHQVGGHSILLSLDKYSVCKPLISREHLFYETLPKEMKKFTPAYKGIIEVTFEEDSEGYISLISYPYESPHSSEELVSVSPKSSSSKNNTKVRLKRSGSIEIINFKRDVFEDSDQSEIRIGSGHNPWVVQCHKEALAKMRQNCTQSKPQKFILLENLAAQFFFPCVLDMKMGTRQHGDDATVKKQQTQIAKCASTTSSTIGLRIGGMQVYQVNTEKFLCHNKYFGRTLSLDGFKKTLYQFFHNGYRLRKEVISLVIEHLKELYAAIEKQNSFRFYSGSLLVMYDGKESNYVSQPLSTENSDLLLIKESCENNVRSQGSSFFKDLPQSSVKLDVRMIDFAHSTHVGFFKDDIVHSGPDRGYLFGLENFINVLTDFLTGKCTYTI